MKKLKLEDIQIASFVTSSESDEIKGGVFDPKNFRRVARIYDVLQGRHQRRQTVIGPRRQAL